MTLGSHMVLQRAPKSAIVWGYTAAGSVVRTTMVAANQTACAHGPSPSMCHKTFSTVAGDDGTWRQSLPPMLASRVTFNLSFASSSPKAEQAVLVDVLFGDVFMCGGQSNMEFAMPAVANASIERQRANAFPNIRIFSVGHRTSSPTPLLDLQTVWEVRTRALGWATERRLQSARRWSRYA